MMDVAKVAFTGKLVSMTRREAAQRIAQLGGRTSDAIGRDTTMLVVGMDGWPLLPDGSVSQKLTRAQALAAQGSKIRIVSEERFLETLGLRNRNQSLRKSYTAEQICQIVNIDSTQLLRLEYAGLIHSDEGRFDFQDIVSLKTIAELISRGVKQQTIAKSIAQLASILPGTDRPLAQLKLVSEPSGRLLAEVEGLLIEPGGQIRLNFDADAEAESSVLHEPKPLAPPRMHEPDAEAVFARAVELEDEGLLEDAERAYRETLALDPSMASAHFNLANVLFALNKSEAAQERLRAALEHDPNFEMAWFNLACMHESRGEFEQAIKSYDRAIAIDPLYADAHFNLATCYERIGQLANAAHHWRTYLSLDNSSAWADHARRSLRQA